MTRPVCALTTLGAVAILLLAGLVFWHFWWVPRAAYSCDGMPTGASSPRAAAERFLDGLARHDSAAMCAALVDKLSDAELASLDAQLTAELGTPSGPEHVDIQIGEQMGSTLPLTFVGPGGTVDMSVHSFQGWYRVQT